jgi:DnaK suppressor protein
MGVMIKEQKEELENLIKEKIEAIKEDIISYQRITRPIPPDNAIGRLTRMEAISSKSINEALLRKATDNLAKLEHTLKKIDDPDFGLCRECEETIPIARLLIMPEAGLCVECADRKS